MIIENILILIGIEIGVANILALIGIIIKTHQLKMENKLW